MSNVHILLDPSLDMASARKKKPRMQSIAHGGPMIYNAHHKNANCLLTHSPIIVPVKAANQNCIIIMKKENKCFDLCISSTRNSNDSDSGSTFSTKLNRLCAVWTRWNFRSVLLKLKFKLT